MTPAQFDCVPHFKQFGATRRRVGQQRFYHCTSRNLHLVYADIPLIEQALHYTGEMIFQFIQIAVTPDAYLLGPNRECSLCADVNAL